MTVDTRCHRTYTPPSDDVRKDGGDTMDLIERLLRGTADLEYKDLNARAVDATKRFLLDTFGVCAAAFTSPEAGVVRRTIDKWGGNPESTPWFSGEKVPAPSAALLNGTLVHSKEFDCIHPAGIHPMSTITAATLAVAEQAGGVSGKDFLTAMALGVDLACRVGKGCKRGLVFYRPATCGAFGAVYGGSRLAGLDVERTLDALGVMYSQISGTLQSHSEGVLVNTMQPAFAARSAVVSTNLAAEGMTGPRGLLEGLYGYYRLFEGGDYDAERPLEGLGTTFEIENLAYKPYCTGRLANGGVEAALKARAEHHLDPANIKGAKVTAPELSMRLVGRPAIQGKMTPQSARLCLPYAVAVALLYGDVWISHFEADGLADDAIFDLASRVEVVQDPDNNDPQSMVPLYLDIYTNNGTIHEELHVLKGSPESPLTEEEAMVKFRRGWNHTGKLDPDGADRLIGLIDRLEDVDDISELTSILTLT